MSKIKLQNRKIQKMSNYHYISIPKTYIDNDLLSMKKKYKITLEEIPENHLETATEESH